MAELTVPSLDFSGLGQLPKVYREAQKERTLADLGKGLADGSIDYKQAGATLASLGDINAGLSLMKLGDEQQAGQEFSKTIAGMYQPSAVPAAPNQPQPQQPLPPLAQQPQPRGDPAHAIASIESGGKYDALGPVTRTGDRAFGKYQVMGANIGPWSREILGQEVTPQQFLASPELQDKIFQGKFGQYSQKYGPEGAAKAWFAGEGGMNNPNARDQLGTTVSSYADKFNKALGPQVASLGPQPGGVPVAPAQAPQQAPTPAQALPAALMQDPSTAKIGELLAASVNPRLPAAQKEVAKTLLAHALKASELTADQKEYLGAVAQGETASFTDWTRANKGAGATKITIDQKGEAKFEEEFGKKQADRWNKYIENADAAERKLVDINTMREIHQRAGSQGIGANIKETIGPYAEALGVNIEGLSDIQAYSQVIQRLAPQQRAPGSGSTSDIEFKGFLKSLPGLSQNPVAREVGLNTMEALARDDMARGAIATKLATGEIKRAQAEKEMRDLPDPMKGFVEWRKANPELYGQALKTAYTAPPKSEAPKSAAPVRVNSAAERDALKSGTDYVAPDGSIRTRQ